MKSFQLTSQFSLLACCVLSSDSSALANHGSVVGVGVGTSSSTDSCIAQPVVYTIAGSDSGGGAGIQADLLAIHSMNCHGCSAITCLTAQNSVGVTGVHAPPPSFLKQQLDTLLSDMPPMAVKIGMLGTKDLALCVGGFLKELRDRDGKVWVVLDPVMISTSGHKLIDDDAKQAMIEHVFPYADILTPNKYEAEDLLGRKFESNQDVVQGTHHTHKSGHFVNFCLLSPHKTVFPPFDTGAKDIVEMGVSSVLIKGGHAVNDLKFAQDYFLSAHPPASAEERLFESRQGIWLRSPRYKTNNTHGTGCTLSSAIASALALGEQQRSSSMVNVDGATSAIDLVDACCLAKAFVTAGIFHGVQYGQGPGPVAHTQFPSSFQHYPLLTNNPLHDNASAGEFCCMKSFSDKSDDDRVVLGRILPVVDNVELVEHLANIPGVTDIQLRIKDASDPETILQKSIQSQKICEALGVRLWINDHWEAAVTAGCFGIHVGQGDLVKSMKSGGIDELKQRGMALGISTHSYAELSTALGLKPSYISLGPIFATKSKNVEFNPQGLATLSKWRQLIPPEIPLVAIGGIHDEKLAREVRAAGADCVAVIGAVTTVESVESAVSSLCEAMA